MPRMRGFESLCAIVLMRDRVKYKKKLDFLFDLWYNIGKIELILIVCGTYKLLIILFLLCRWGIM
jgi:hypothetical protein